jgi:hypothetical protein
VSLPQVFSFGLAFLKWPTPVIHRGLWERFITELCSEFRQNLSKLVRNLTIMHCVTSEATTCSLNVITPDKKQADIQRYVVTVVGIPSLTTSKEILSGNLCAWGKKTGLYTNWSRDISVGTVTGYELDDRMIGVQFPAGDENFSLRYHVQTCSGAHPASSPMGTRGSFPGGKAAGAWRWPPFI